MMCIMHRSPTTGVETQFTWHVGEPIAWDRIAFADNVYAVQADGEELGHINWNFHNMPIVLGKGVQCWYGDLAKFIAGNL